MIYFDLIYLLIKIHNNTAIAVLLCIFISK